MGSSRARAAPRTKSNASNSRICITQLLEFVRVRRPELRRSASDADVLVQQAAPPYAPTARAPSAALGAGSTRGPAVAAASCARPRSKRPRVITDSTDSSDGSSEDEQQLEEEEELGEQHAGSTSAEQPGPSEPAAASSVDLTVRPRRVRNGVDCFA
eukprot:2068496-Pleurochrysis_carterae.AAC.1